MPGTDIVGPATQASGDLVDQVEHSLLLMALQDPQGLVGTLER